MFLRDLQEKKFIVETWFWDSKSKIHSCYHLNHGRKLLQNVGTELDAQQTVLVHQYRWPCYKYVRWVITHRIRT